MDGCQMARKSSETQVKRRDSKQVKQERDLLGVPGIDHPLYRVWKGMKQRCNNYNSKDYPRYGGRGITICQEWVADFAKFYLWAMDAGWQTGLQLDRADNDGPYSPENCRWATRKQNMDNRRTTRRFEYEGELLTAKEIFDRSAPEVNFVAFLRRLYKGWSVSDAIKLPNMTNGQESMKYKNAS